MRKITVLSFLIFAAVFPAHAQSLLPDSFGKWTTQPIKALDVNLGNDAAAFHEYGLVGTESRIYERAGENIGVALWKFQDPTGGYGGYSYLRTADMARSDLAEHASYSKNRCLILVGNIVIDVTGPNVPKDLASLADLKKAIEPSAQSGPFPALWEFLPTRGIQEGTNHYVLGPAGLSKFLALAPGDWLGFSDGAEAEVANYKIGGDPLSLLIADFPTPQFAQKRLEELERIMKINDPNPAQNGSALYAKRSNTLVIIVSGAKSKSEANVLLDQISAGSEVTWNEPTFQFTQPNIGTIVVGTIIGTAMICMFAIVAGVAFGGVRIVTKIAFPDKVFDRSSQVQILQLGLSSKPINAEDFYGIELGRKRHVRGGKL